MKQQLEQQSKEQKRMQEELKRHNEEQISKIKLDLQAVSYTHLFSVSYVYRSNQS